jgi:hypothetical protein
VPVTVPFGETGPTGVGVRVWISVTGLPEPFERAKTFWVALTVYPVR